MLSTLSLFSPTDLFLSLCVQNNFSTAKSTELYSWWGHILPTPEAHGPEAAQTEGCCYTTYCESIHFVYYSCINDIDVFLRHKTTVGNLNISAFLALESILDMCSVFVTENWFAQLSNTPTHSSIAVVSMLSLYLCYRDNSITGEKV